MECKMDTCIYYHKSSGYPRSTPGWMVRTCIPLVDGWRLEIKTSFIEKDLGSYWMTTYARVLCADSINRGVFNFMEPSAGSCFVGDFKELLAELTECGRKRGFSQKVVCGFHDSVIQRLEFDKLKAKIIEHYASPKQYRKNAAELVSVLRGELSFG